MHACDVVVETRRRRRLRSHKFGETAETVQVRPTLLPSYDPDEQDQFSLGIRSTYYDIPGRAPRCMHTPPVRARPVLQYAVSHGAGPRTG